MSQPASHTAGPPARHGFALALAALALIACGPAAGAPGAPESETAAPVIRTDENLISVTQDDTILWNGRAVSLEQLRTLLAETKRLPNEPQLRYEPETSANYDTLAEVLRAIKEAGVTKFGFVGNEKYPAPAANED